jgi:hypothetical protein
VRRQIEAVLAKHQILPLPVQVEPVTSIPKVTSGKSPLIKALSAQAMRSSP